MEQAIVVSHRQLAAEYKSLVMIAVVDYLFKVVLQITLYFAHSDVIDNQQILVGELLEEVRKIDGVTVLTADHGNAEKMRDERGFAHTSHTCTLVPFSVIGYDCTLKSNSSLCDIAPTICEILGIKKPDEMSGVSLIK